MIIRVSVVWFLWHKVGYGVLVHGNWCCTAGLCLSENECWHHGFTHFQPPLLSMIWPEEWIYHHYTLGSATWNISWTDLIRVYIISVSGFLWFQQSLIVYFNNHESLAKPVSFSSWNKIHRVTNDEKCSRFTKFTVAFIHFYSCLLYNNLIIVCGANAHILQIAFQHRQLK